MKGKIYLFRIGTSFLLLVFFAVISLAQDQQQHVYDIPGLSFEVEQRRLDEVAKELKLYPNKNVYLIAFNKVGTKKSTAITRLKKSQEYLIKKYDVSSKRIITRYGGSNDDGIVMRIFIVDRDSPNFSIKEKVN